MITNIHDLDLTKTYTYTDYLTWKFRERVELLMGKIFKMTPAPSRAHQEVLGKLHLLIGNKLSGTKCNIYIAPFDVRLTNQDGVANTVVQPDLCIVCDPSQLDERGCNGAPDLIVEVLSPSTSSKDLNEKYFIYQSAGVLEYWTVEPVDGLVSIYTLEDGEYRTYKPYTVNEILTSKLFPNLEIDLKELFPNLLKEPEDEYFDKRI